MLPAFIFNVELGGRPLRAEEAGPVYRDLIAGDGTGFVVIGETGYRVIGVCAVSFLKALRCQGRYAIIQGMYVEPEVRGMGIGMSILCFALDQAARAGCRYIELGTPKAGQRQIRFYEGAVFLQVGARLRLTPNCSG